jgi:hypothetical protein
MMRFTIVDDRSTTSFLAPPHVLKAITACCARGAASTRDVLTMLAEYDACLAIEIRDQLSVFREHNTNSDTGWIRARFDEKLEDAGPFDVLDERTRRASLEPTRLGLVVFNLPARRIVQVQNTYANLQRSDRGRVRRDGKATQTFYSYTLPSDWSIVP